MNGDPISAESRVAIAAAQTENLGIYVSPMAAWEIATLAAKDRLQLTLSPEAWFNELMRLPGLRLAPMTPGVLIASASLPGAPPKDPVDRIIAATSRTYGFSLITRNGMLMLYARAGHIDAVGC
jgi:PIN domain nuclease of toxin-antitoxin system